MVGACIPGDVKHPGLEPAVVAECFAVLQDSKEDVLNKVIGCRPVSRHSREEIKQYPMVPVEEDTELGDIAASDQEHQRFVRLRHFTGKNCHFLKRLPDLIRVIRVIRG